jgi:very-short-patch-repair endonuclease
MRDDETSRLRGFAKTMRSNQTDAEAVLWDALRARRLNGLKFRRQVPIANYIADFACVAHHLIVEVDGSHHGDSAYDQARDNVLRSEGYTVLRFWNDDVLKSLDDVCQHIVSVTMDG